MMSYVSNRNYSPKSASSIIYSDMHGVDFSGDGSDISRHRFAYLENMYRDYDGDGAGAVESIPGFRKIAKVEGAPNGLFSYKNAAGEDMLVLHASDKLYRIAVKDIDSSKELTPIANLADAKSSAYTFGGSLFVLDGESITRVSDLYCGKISDTGGGIYIPTTYINGKTYEQRNMLTRKFMEKTVLGSAADHTYGSSEIKYSITDAEAKTCRATGLFNSDVTELYIPSRTKIGDTYYSVTEIGVKAFRGVKSLRKCRIAEGVKAIGNLAFWGCSSLESVILPDSVRTVGNAVFSECASLTELHLGGGLTSVGANAVALCTSLEAIGYAGDEMEFSRIEGKDVFSGKDIAYNEIRTETDIGIDVYSPATSITEVTADNIPYDFTVIEKGGLCTCIRIHTEDRAELEGKTVTVSGILSSAKKDYAAHETGFLTSRFIGGSSVSAVIEECRIAESFDGRIFITGNPDYPGVCFYSCMDSTGEYNPLYFGDMNYFSDGVGSFGITALLATADNLAVFKSGDDGGGSIYYHVSHDTGVDLVPKIYPVSYIHSGVVALSDAVSFFDDPVFITECGLCALDKKQINLERSVAVRSHNVNPKLLTEKLSEAQLAVWRGYLAVATEGRIYLADSRDTFRHPTGAVEYEWYYLDGIGSWSGGERVYRYSANASEGLSAHPDTDERAVWTVYSKRVGETAVYYTSEGGAYYAVYPTDEYTGGTFHPAKLIHTVGERLFFVSENGTLMVFNNDKRASLPEEVKLIYTDREERAAYVEALGRRIHPDFYSFGNRAPRYALVTARDNCGIPHLEKNTVKDSLTLKCRTMSSTKIRCEVGTDKEGYSEICRFPGTSFVFDDLNFSTLSFSTQDTYTVPVSEKTKGWVEKQISIYSDGFRAPFGLYTVAYRFTVRGSIKKNR